jgi:hypothetical protein
MGEYVPKLKAIKMLQQVNPEEYSKSDAIYIYNEISNLNKKCLGYTISENYKKILNDNARKDNSVSFWYNKDYEGLEVENIEIIKPDGQVIAFDAKKILEEKDNTTMAGSNIYSDLSKVLTGELPDVQIGDIIFTKHKTLIKKAPMENHFFGYFGVEDYSPYLNKYKEISLPAKKKLFIHDLNNKGLKYDHSKEKRDKHVVYRWNVAKIPIIVHEPNMESHNLFAHQIILTTVQTWEEISRWYYRMVKPHLKVNQAIKDKVHELVKGAQTRKEKLSRIFYWTANKIRYVGVDREKYRPYLEPHDVVYTFETRGGVCRDKAALLTAMFRIAGIKSDVILISAGSRLNVEAPTLWFNHAITVSYDETGQPEYIFDPTDENTKDFLPKYEEDNTYLIASKRGESLRLTPVSPPENNNSTLNIELQIDNDGHARGEVEFMFSGFTDTIIRNYFAELNPTEIKNTVSNIVQIVHPNTEIIRFKCSDYRDKTKNMSIRATFNVMNYVSMINNMIFIPFDAANLKIHLLYNYIMSPFNLSTRRYDFKMPGAFSLDTNLKVTFSSRPRSLSLPIIKTIDFKGFQTTLKSQVKDNQLLVNYHFKTSKIHFKKEDFLTIKSKIGELFKNDNLYLIGNPGGSND